MNPTEERPENPLFREAAAAMMRAGLAMARTHESLVASHTHIVEANADLVAAVQQFSTALDAIDRAHEEHEDLRDTVARLEKLVTELVERGRP